LKFQIESANSIILDFALGSIRINQAYTSQLHASQGLQRASSQNYLLSGGPVSRPEFYETSLYPKTLLLGVYAPYNQTKNIQAYFDEFLSLAKTNDVRNFQTMMIKIRDIDPGYFISKGKLTELKELCDDQKIEEVIISEMLTAQQERNLSDFLNCRVFDRTQLILEIFEKAAHSAEGKAQVGIAMLTYQRARLAGKGMHLNQQSGIRGFKSGYGETQKEKERRHIEHTILKLRRQIDELHKTRETQRKQRLTNRIPHICIIGYTNAGKSTLLNTMTKSTVLAEDKLFATLDTTTRELYINKKKIGIMSDTVGFIQNLPHHLIDAFKSTLSELKYADILVQVIDVSDTNWESHVDVVRQILEELQVEKEMLYVFNKVDKLSEHELNNQLGVLSRYQPHVLVSATSRESLQPLSDYLAEWSERTEKEKKEASL
jgi:GTP-binding protein HflX